MCNTQVMYLTPGHATLVYVAFFQGLSVRGSTTHGTLLSCPKQQGLINYSETCCCACAFWSLVGFSARSMLASAVIAFVMMGRD